MENFYEELYQYLIERGIDDDEATEVVNYLYEDNIHEYELLTENRGRAFLNMLRAVGYMSGVLKKPGARQAVKRVIPKVQQGTPLQGNLLTKKGTAQNFTGGRMPFTGTSPVPAASSPLPQPAAPAPQAPGQMRIPGLSSRAQELRNVTGNPNLGLPGNKTGGFGVTGGSNVTRNQSVFKTQPTRTAPELPQPPATPAVVKLKKAALPVGVAGATGLALSGGQPPKKGEDPRRPDGSLPPYTPPRPAADPAPPKKAVVPATDSPIMSSSSTYTGDRLKRPASKLTSAAKDFDKAFAAARKEGKKEFTWRGKQYNTKYKGE
tara:strand:+ start:251 stop:1210 length:960 start_codon:yes stop_codon:yes gene_type:complete